MPEIFFPSSRQRFINQQEVIADLRGLALRVAQRHGNIEAVYLFGSYAQGNASLHSDADILVVLSQDDRPVMDRLDEFILEFSEGPIPVDVIVYTRSELDALLKEGNRFLHNVLSGIRLAGNQR